MGQGHGTGEYVCEASVRIIRRKVHNIVNCKKKKIWKPL